MLLSLGTSQTWVLRDVRVHQWQFLKCSALTQCRELMSLTSALPKEVLSDVCAWINRHAYEKRLIKSTIFDSSLSLLIAMHNNSLFCRGAGLRQIPLQVTFQWAVSEGGNKQFSSELCTTEHKLSIPPMWLKFQRGSVPLPFTVIDLQHSMLTLEDLDYIFFSIQCTHYLLCSKTQCVMLIRMACLCVCARLYLLFECGVFTEWSASPKLVP